MIYNITRLLFFLISKVFFKLEIQGKEVIPPKGPFIVAANHISYLDPPVIGLSCYPRKLYYFGKQELSYNPLFGFYLRKLQMIPVKREKSGPGSLLKAIKLLKSFPLLIFPQGTRTWDFEIARAGVGFLVKKTKVPVIAAKIYGSDEILPRGAKMPRRGRIKVVFSRVDTIVSQDSYEDIARKIMEKIKSL